MTKTPLHTAFKSIVINADTFGPFHQLNPTPLGRLFPDTFGPFYKFRV